MSIISGITVDWSSSPRIITIPAPLTEVIVEDLQDTLLDIEDSEEGICFSNLRDASGMEDLGGGIYVGLTIKLLNAKLKFEDRSGPDFIQCTIKGGNLVGGIEGNPIEESEYTQVKLILSAAGTITVTGSGVTEQDKIDIANKVEDLTAPIKAKTDKLPSGIKRKIALPKFAFLMTDLTTNKPKSNLQVATKISKDGEAFENTTNEVQEIGFGVYKIFLTETETDADIIILKATASDSNQMTLVLKTSE